MSYPLDRINSVNLGLGGSDREDEFVGGSDSDFRLQDRFWIAGYSHDTITGRYLVPTRGRRLRLFYQHGVNEFGGEETYKTRGLTGTQYIPLPRESTLASRIYYGRSTGENAQVFRLGGVDRIRGLSSGSLENKKHNVVIGSAEARLRMKYLDARTKFLFPDFFFKAAYLITFVDAGFGWDNQSERDAFETSSILNSVGTGISWPTYIMQTFQINFTVLWSVQTNDGTEVWYITVGPSF